MSSHLEVGNGWGQESSRTRPVDILVTNWDNDISAAFDVTVASPLNSSTITEAGMYSGAAARAAELRKHTQNDSKCAELSWKCIPLAVECYGAWGPEALKAFSQVATRLAIRGNTSKSMALTDLFGRLSHSLIRANARAILSCPTPTLCSRWMNFNWCVFVWIANEYNYFIIIIKLILLFIVNI